MVLKPLEDLSEELLVVENLNELVFLPLSLLDSCIFG